MPHYYLSTFIGTGEGDDPYRPPTDQPMGLIDLRGDPTRQDGHSLLVVDDPLPPQPGVHKLADNLDEPLTAKSLATIRSRLGVTLQPGTLRAGIVELLLRHATPPHDKGRWNRIHTNHRRRHKIVLGNQVVYDAPDIRNSIITDDFNRSDEPLNDSPNWDIVGDGSVNFAVLTNRLDLTGVFVKIGLGWWSADSFGPNSYVQAEFIADFFDVSGLTIRYADSDNYYSGRDHYGVHRIYKTVGGTSTQLATGGTPFFGLWYFEADGSTLTLKVDDVQKLQVTDTDLTDAGFCGFIGFDTNTGVTWDDFEAGDLPTTLTGVLFVKAATFPVGQISRGRSWVDNKVAYTKLIPSAPNPL